MEYKKKGIREQLFQYYFLFTEIDLMFKVSDEYVCVPEFSCMTHAAHF